MLIETKLHPPVLRPGLIERPGLLQELDAADGARIAVVSTPAGYGKTTLLGQWVQSLRDRGSAVGWLSLDPQDDNIGRFLEYFVAAIARATPEVGEGLNALLRSSPVPQVSSTLTTLVNDLSKRAQPLWLMLDDCHHLSSAEVAEFLESFLVYAPPSIRLVLATRGQVPLKVANLRVKGQLLWLDEASLRFSLGESERFLNGAQGLALEPNDLAVLQSRTEGWIAGLQLASVSLRNRQERHDFIRRFSGSDRDIAGFLLHDVLESQSPSLIDFLLKSSVLERLSEPLAAAVTGYDDAAERLAEIETKNLFLVPLDEGRSWFRYHHLFADLLRSRLEQQAPETIPDLHRRAAAWLAENGHASDAVHHALAMGDSSLAAELVERCSMPLIHRGDVTMVRQWLNRLPADAVAARPRLQLAQVWIMLHISHPRPAADILRSARNAIAALDREGRLSSEERESLQVQLFTLTAGIASAVDRSATAARLARRWLTRIPDSQAFAKGTLYNVLGYSSLALGQLEETRLACIKARDCHEQAGSVLGTVYADLITGLAEVAAGKLTTAHDHFTQATRRTQSEIGAGSYVESAVSIFEAELYYEWNDIETAERILEAHGPVVEECGLVVHDISSKLHLARILAFRGRLGEALALLERSEREGLQTRYRRLFACALHERVRLLLSRGDVQAARLALQARGIDEERIAAADKLGPANEPEQMALARLLLAEGRPEAALRLLDQLVGPLREDGRWRRYAEVRALSAICAFQAGDALTALAAIVETVSLTAPQRALRGLMDEGRPLLEVVNFGRSRIPSWKTDGEIARFVALLLDRPDTPELRELQSRRSTGLPQFSPREAEVARLLCGGLSNRDVAKSLSMAPDTVKWHLKNIFGKLGVSNRTQAVLRLQEIGLTE